MSFNNNNSNNTKFYEDRLSSRSPAPSTARAGLQAESARRIQLAAARGRQRQRWEEQVQGNVGRRGVTFGEDSVREIPARGEDLYMFEDESYDQFGELEITQARIASLEDQLRQAKLEESRLQSGRHGREHVRSGLREANRVIALAEDLFASDDTFGGRSSTPSATTTGSSVSTGSSGMGCFDPFAGFDLSAPPAPPVLTTSHAPSAPARSVIVPTPPSKFSSGSSTPSNPLLAGEYGLKPKGKPASSPAPVTTVTTTSVAKPTRKSSTPVGPTLVVPDPVGVVYPTGPFGPCVVADPFGGAVVTGVAPVPTVFDPFGGFVVGGPIGVPMAVPECGGFISYGEGTWFGMS